MIKYIPLILNLYNGAMIVPTLRINSSVVDDATLSGIRSLNRLADRIVKIGRMTAVTMLLVDELTCINNNVMLADLTK